MSSEDADDTGRAERQTGVTSSGDNTGKNELKQGIWSRLYWSFPSKQSTTSEPKTSPTGLPRDRLLKTGHAGLPRIPESMISSAAASVMFGDQSPLKKNHIVPGS